jgi:hypothetical protein
VGQLARRRRHPNTVVKRNANLGNCGVNSADLELSAPTVKSRIALPHTRSVARRIAPAALVLTCGLVQGLIAQGIPEPSLVLYGVVRNLAPGGGRMSFGSLSWVFQPSGGGPAITLNGVLTNINDQFSYVLRIPCETELPGVALSAGVLKLAATPTSYNRAQVTIEGAVASFSQPAQTNLVLTRTDRGRVERVDLTVTLDTGGGLPDAWQIQYFGHTGIDPADDPDHDGLSNRAEFVAGTSPTDPKSQFDVLDVAADPLGGVRVAWSSVAGRFYTLQRSGDLLTGFTDVQTHVAATPPQNSVRDSGATGLGPFFYRVVVEE